MWSFICKHSASTTVKLSHRNSLHHGGAILTNLHHNNNNNFNHKSLHHHHNSFHTFLNHTFPKSQSTTTTTTTTDATDATTTPPTVTIPIELLRGTLSHVREYLSASTIYRNQIHEQQTASATGINEEEEGVGQMYQEPSANFSVSAIDMLEHSITQLIAQVSSMKQYSTRDLFTMLQFLYVVTEWRSYESQLSSNDNDASQARTLEMHQKDKLLYIKCLQLSEYLIHRSTNEIKLINSNSSSSGNSSRLLEMVQLNFSVLCIRLQSSFHLGDIAMMKSCYQDALKYLKREITVYGQRKNKSVSDSHFTSLHLDLNNVSALFSSAPHLGLYEDMLFIGDVMKRCYPSGKFEEIMAGFHESADSVDTYFDYSAIYQLLTELVQKNGFVENYEYEEATTASSKTKKNSKQPKRDTMKAGQFEVKNLMFNHLETKETGNTLAHKQFSDYSNFSDENEWIKIDYELPTLLTHGRAVLWYQLNGGIPLAGIQMKNGDIHVAGFRDMSGSDIAPVEDIEQPDSQQQQSQPQQDNSLSEEDVESYREEMIKELEKGEETLTDPAERAQVTEMIDKFNDPNKLLDDKEDEEIDFQSLKVHVHFHFVPQDKATNSFTGRYFRKLHAVKEGSKDEAVIKFIFDMKADILPLQQEEN